MLPVAQPDRRPCGFPGDGCAPLSRVRGGFHFTNKTAAAVAHDGREGDTHNMSTPFDDTTDRQERPVIGRSIHPGYIDVPFAVNEVLDHRGQQTIGDTLEVRTLDRDLLDQLEAEVTLYEKDAAKEIAALRKQIDARRFVLDVTAGLAISSAA